MNISCLLLCLLLINSVYANTNKEEQADTVAKKEHRIKSQDNQIVEKLNTLKSHSAWQNFLKNKELNDINYDLYRMTGDTIKDNVIARGAGDPKGYLVMKHEQVFCSTKVDPNCKISDPFAEYADIKFSILDQNVYTDNKQVVLANEFIRNVTNPFPSKIALEMLNAGSNERRLPQNQAALAEALVQEARTSVAKHSFNNMILNRLSLGSIEGGASGNDKNFSQLTLIEQGAKSRFEDRAWHESVDRANQEDLFREMLKMEAFKIWMEYHKYKQNERIEALLATIASEQANITQLLKENNNIYETNR